MQRLGLGRLYPITESSQRARWSHVDLARQLLEGGARFFQVREKQMDDRRLLEELRAVRGLADQFGARFLVNDRADLALASAADGVHLGQSDLPPDAARAMLGPRAIIGLSTHTLEQFRQAQAESQADYLALGPVFPTPSKTAQTAPLGLEGLRRIVEADHTLPVVAIGGIRLENALAVLETGVDAIAVLSDIAHSPDPGRRVARYLELTGSPGRSAP